MKLELIVKLRFKASHTLQENETVHEHQWRVDTTITGPIQDGRVISLPLAQNILNSKLELIRGTFLNENPHLDEKSRAFPTCENIAFYLHKEFSSALRVLAPDHPDLSITQIEIGVNEDETHEMGAARLSL